MLRFADRFSDDFKKPWTQVSGNADITCTQLNFHHPGRVDLLQDFSLTVPGGKVIALIGKLGCGKSTLAKLITNLYKRQMRAETDCTNRAIASALKYQI